MKIKTRTLIIVVVRFGNLVLFQNIASVSKIFSLVTIAITLQKESDHPPWS